MSSKFRLLPILFMLVTAIAGAQVTVNTFEGIDASNDFGPEFGIDPNGAVGTLQYVEWTNDSYWAFPKTSPYTPLSATPVPGYTPWAQNNMTDCEPYSGNVQLNFDHLASRWVIGRRLGNSSAYFYCIAVSQTQDMSVNNGQGSWYTYELALNSILGQNPEGVTYYPDYPKIGTWADGYYVTIDLEDPNRNFDEVGIVVCAFDRTTMLTGGTMRTPQCFRELPNANGNFLAHSLEPADIDGTYAPPTGALEYFLSLENPTPPATTSNSLNLWSFHVDWNTPANSKFTGPTSQVVNTYTQGCYDEGGNPYNTVCVPEPSTSSTKVYIDSVGDRLMQRFAYRRFPNQYQSYLVTHAVQVGTGVGSQTGIRWYEFRIGGKGHSGTIMHNDGNYRMMPSIAQDSDANMAVGYTVSGPATHPSIAMSYTNLSNPAAPPEILIYSGSADEENSFIWGVYTSMTIDPVDDCTFWYVNEYFSSNQITNLTWRTRIANFKLPGCTPK